MKPWYKVVTPREDLREGKALDAAEFAVHLDHVRDGRAGPDYQDPARFFERTFLTKNLTQLASETLRRLSGEVTETSAVFNMATQFGGGKTHALTLLYHLARGGAAAADWAGVSALLGQAKVPKVPEATAAVFVGTEFDSIQGRGGDDGTPKRFTPWGEIAFQLGGEKSFKVIEKHDQERTAPAGDAIRAMLPNGQPALILMDELMNYVSRNRKSGLSSQLYDFLHSLSETARGERNVVLVASIPASELEMTAEDQSDYTRFKKMLDRLGKPIIMSADAETSEIIRRRLFEWDLRAISREGRVILGKDAVATCKEYAAWVHQYRQQVPSTFPIDEAENQFKATYPFHPALLSVFERKWQALPRFQQTRGTLRLLAQWVSDAYRTGYKSAQGDGLIGLGTAPLQDSLFRRAIWEQLGDDRLESAINADICGRSDSFALRLDAEAVDTIKKGRLHQKVATAILFESSGGQQQKDASLPEIRFAVAGPEDDIGNVESVLEALQGSCYYLAAVKNRYRFTMTPQLNKLLADRRASIKPESIEKRVRDEIESVFSKQQGVERVYFPDRSNQVPDRPVITIVVLAPERGSTESETARFIEQVTREYGSAGRTYKSALIWAVADSPAVLQEEARKLLAWQDIEANEADRMDDIQRQQLTQSSKKAERDLREAVWRSYKNLALLGRDNKIRMVDFGLIHSSSAVSIAELILTRLRQDDEAVDAVNPNFLVRNWPPALTEWSTRSLRDAFFASPLFPRLLVADRLKETIVRGVSSGQLAYVGKKTATGKYDPFFFEFALEPSDVEFSDDVFIIQALEARKQIEPPVLTALEVRPDRIDVAPTKRFTFSARGIDQFGHDMHLDETTWSASGGEIDARGTYSAAEDPGDYVVTATSGGLNGSAHVWVGVQPAAGSTTGAPDVGPGQLRWFGEIPAQKWMQFYTKVLARFVGSEGLRLEVKVSVAPEGGVSRQQADEVKAALRELGLEGRVESD